MKMISSSFALELNPVPHMNREGKLEVVFDTKSQDGDVVLLQVLIIVLNAVDCENYG